jgi:predicted DNA-binding protein
MNVLEYWTSLLYFLDLQASDMIVVLAMGTTTEDPNIRISPQAQAALRELATREGRPMETVLDEAIEQREKLLDAANAAYAQLRADPESWKEELAERRHWDGAVADGLESEWARRKRPAATCGL